jgi:hypothetical protein
MLNDRSVAFLFILNGLLANPGTQRAGLIEDAWKLSEEAFRAMNPASPASPAMPKPTAVAPEPRFEDDEPAA